MFNSILLGVVLGITLTGCNKTDLCPTEDVLFDISITGHYELSSTSGLFDYYPIKKDTTSNTNHLLINMTTNNWMFIRSCDIKPVVINYMDTEYILEPNESISLPVYPCYY